MIKKLNLKNRQKKYLFDHVCYYYVKFNQLLPKQATERAVSSVGRAPALQAGGHWFESSTAHLPAIVEGSSSKGLGQGPSKSLM